MLKQKIMTKYVSQNLILLVKLCLTKMGFLKFLIWSIPINVHMSKEAIKKRFDYEQKKANFKMEMRGVLPANPASGRDLLSFEIRMQGLQASGP